METSERENVLFNMNEAAMLANACIASATSSTASTFRLLVSDEKHVLETVKGTTGRVVSAKTVAKELDEKIIRAAPAKGTTRRYVGEAEVLYLAFVNFARRLKLRPSAKAELYKTLITLTAPYNGPRRGRSKPKKAPGVELSRYIKFEPGDDLNKWLELLDTYITRRNDYIEINPDIMGGTPVIRGTRVPVYTVLQLLERRRSVDQILEELPYLSRKGIEAAVIYARAHPRTGRRKIFR
jgi:uncharacterized protein (DUF433 family)